MKKLLLAFALAFIGISYAQAQAVKPTLCDQSAVISVTAAATTEIVPLTSGQSIRVCGFVISMSTAGTAKFVQGTGTNCGTGTADMTGAMPLGTTLPASPQAGGGNIIFKVPASKALCLAAVTGNVVGVLSFAKY